MPQNPPIEVVCEISSIEPISGRLRRAERSEEFRGWMDFATALLTIAGDETTNGNRTEPIEAPEKEI